jgi:hypothetical protein
MRVDDFTRRELGLGEDMPQQQQQQQHNARDEGADRPKARRCVGRGGVGGVKDI